MEALKDGYVFSAKYESCMLRLKPLHLVVLCNRLPDQEALSEDRYSYQETYTGMSIEAQLARYYPMPTTSEYALWKAQVLWRCPSAGQASHCSSSHCS
eukprot:5935713-Pleurochrysis_carterae.AAC.2